MPGAILDSGEMKISRTYLLPFRDLTIMVGGWHINREQHGEIMVYDAQHCAWPLQCVQQMVAATIIIDVIVVLINANRELRSKYYGRGE